jgi:hypothetical protein
LRALAVAEQAKRGGAATQEVRIVDVTWTLIERAERGAPMHRLRNMIIAGREPAEHEFALREHRPNAHVFRMLGVELGEHAMRR